MGALATFLTSFAGAAAGIGVVAWLARTWLGARIKGEVEHLYAARLETIKADLNRQNEVASLRMRTDAANQHEVANAALTSFAANEAALMERRVRAIECLWRAGLDFQAAANHQLGIMFILTQSEIEGALDDPTTRGRIGPFSPDAIGEMLRAQGDIELHRPFIDDVLWAAYCGFRAFNGRLVTILEMGRKEGKIKFWLDDPGIKQILAAALTKEEIASAGKWYSDVQGLLEAALLRAVRRSLSGRSASASALEHAHEVLAAVRRVDRSDSK